MKFQHLKIGQQFEYKGESYIKDGPLMAMHQASGKKVLIPRSADLVITENSPTQAKVELSDSIDSTVVIQALDTYESRCLELFESIAADIRSDKRHQLLAELKQARESFMQAINK